jgi:hypothetical protein
MARGFESKSVADQQDSALEDRQPPREVGDPILLTKRRKLELAQADLMRRLDGAHADGYREMLRRALAAVEDELAAVVKELGASSS